MIARALTIGFAIWAGATIVIRLAGERILRPGVTPALVLYLASFVLMALLVPWLCRLIGAANDARFRAATLLMLPTLLLDPFSCLFFSAVFPNLGPALAGVFGGWMLICCAGAAAGVWLTRR
jgi:hypothetical protein